MMNKEMLNVKYEQEIKKYYSIKLYPMQEEEAVEWVAEISELPGCIGAGDTPEEALVAVKDAKRSWIEVALIDGKTIPEPRNLDALDYSGKFTLRLPKTLHRNLAEAAAQEDISLNQYLIYLLTKKHYEKYIKGVQILFTANKKHYDNIITAQQSRWSQPYVNLKDLDARGAPRVQ